MVNMEVLNDAELLQNLKLRFKGDLIFTQVGPTLLVINPFKKIEKLFDQHVKNTISYSVEISLHATLPRSSQQ